MIQTLWDLLVPKRSKTRPEAMPAPMAPAAHPKAVRKPPAKPEPGRAKETMDARYERVAREMLQQYGVRVRRWRRSMSGVAWELRYRDGSVKKLIEAPRPRGPVSAAVFLHEIGHHAIGFNRYKPRCLEEYHAWEFALREMERTGLSVTEAVHTRVRNSLRYAVAKARRRGIRTIPGELARYT